MPASNFIWTTCATDMRHSTEHRQPQRLHLRLVIAELLRAAMPFLLLSCSFDAAAAALVPGQPSRAGGVPSFAGRSAALRMGAKNKKSSFEEYQIAGEATELFPLPDERRAVHVHKKHMPKGVAIGKAPPGSFDAYMPSLDIAWPGARLLHLAERSHLHRLA